MKENKEQPEKKSSAHSGQLLTIHRALDVLEYLNAEGEPVRLSDISTALGFPKSKVHRILSTLVVRGYVRQNPDTHLYSLGIGTWLLARSLDNIGLLVDFMKPMLESLCEEVGETTFLSVLHKKTVLYLYVQLSPNPVGIYLKNDSRVPFHCTASGKALLSFQSRDCYDELIGADKSLERFTDLTITDPEELWQQVELTRKRGYALESEEMHYGMAAIATAIPALYGDVAAVGIFFPTSRSQKDNMENLVEKLMAIRHQVKEKSAGIGSI